MGKTLRTAAMIVGAVALTATGVGAIAAAAAGPGFTAVSVAGVSMSTWTALAAGSGLVTMATGLAAPGPSLQGSPTKFTADPQAGIPYAIGRTWQSGNIIYRKAHTSPGKVPNDRQTMVVILSGGGPVEQIEAFYSDKAQVTFNSAGAATGNYANYMWQKTQLGATPEAAALSVSSGDGSPPPGWTAQHKLSGYAASILTLRWDSKGKIYPNGVPKPGWVGKWVKVYDPRLDSTYPGGSGSCRALQESTYVWSENPYLHALTWCLGRWANGKRVLGIGAPVEGIDVAAFVEGANIADANGWKAGGVEYSTDRKWDVLKRILQAGGGEPMPLGARISCRINTPRVSLGTVTAADVVGEATVAATQSRRERFNAVIPRYRSEAHGWEFVAADKIVVPEHVAEDGGERCKEITYALVQQAKQAAELARYDIENAREFGPITLPLKPRWIGYKPGDCVTVDLPELGLNNQLVLILRRTLDPSTGIVTLICRSETAAKHAFALGQTTTPPPTPGVSGPPLVPVPSASEWSVSATAISADGVSRPALVISGAATTADPHSILFEYREATGSWGADEGWIAAGTAAGGATRQVIPGVLPGTAYEVAVSYVQFGQQGGRLKLGPVTTGGDTALDRATAAQDAAQAAEQMAQDALATADEIRDAIDEIGESQLLPELAKPINDSLIRSIIDTAHNDRQVFEEGRVQAVHQSEIQKTATDLRAEVTEREALGAKVDDHEALIISTRTALADETQARATAVTQLTARLDSAGGPGVTVEQVLTTQADAIGTLSGSYTVRVNNNGVSTGFGLISGAGGTSEFAVLANRFVVADPANNANTAYPFQVVGGQVYIRKAMIQKIEAGDIEVESLAAITATMGDLDIRPTANMNGRIRVFDENNNLRVVIGRLS